MREDMLPSPVKCIFLSLIDWKLREWFQTLTFYIEIILDLQESCKGSIEFLLLLFFIWFFFFILSHDFPCDVGGCAHSHPRERAATIIGQPQTPASY